MTLVRLDEASIHKIYDTTIVMGKILLQEMGQTTIVPLKEHTILGRSPKSDILLRMQSIPNLWLEIRYLNGDWVWNVLNGEGDTVGAGSYTVNHWRMFSKKIRFNNLISLELIDDSEPKTLIEDQHKRFLPLSRFPTIQQVSVRTFQLNEQLLTNGTAFVYDSKIYTLWVPGSTHATEENSVIDVNDGLLKIDMDALLATFDFGSRQYTLTGEAARSLAVYARAHKEDTDTSWLTTEEAFLDWISLGGSEDSPSERINWERNKIMGKLSKQGSFPVVGLFQRRRRGSIWEHRLDFSGEIQLVNLPSDKD